MPKTPIHPKLHVIASWAICLLAFIASAAAQDRPPNILLIVADDMGYTDLGAFGSEIPTPNLDALAYRGMRLTNFHTGQACRATRLMLMSGASVAAANEPNPDSHRGGQLGLDYATLAELLRDAGYATYMAGKWDVGDLPGYTPDARGFDRSFALLRGSAAHFAEPLFGNFAFHEDGAVLRLEDVPEDFYTTDAFTDNMLGYLRSADSETPWFAYLPYTAPHWPLQLPEEWLDRHAGRYDAGYDALRESRFIRASAAGVIPSGGTLDGFEPVVDPWSELSADEQRRYARAQEIYAGMVEYLDMSVGRVIDYLDERGELDDTVVVFMTDHGASPGEYGVDTGRVRPDRNAPALPPDADNRFENFGRPGSFIDHGRGFGEAATAPFKYQKGDLTEGGLRAAAFIHFPRRVPEDRISDAFITAMDILPTFLEIAGSAHPGAGPYRGGREINDITGRSAWSHFTGRAEQVHAPTDAFGLTGRDGGALIRGGYKIINTPPPGIDGTRPWRLYNLEDDPGEQRDLAGAHVDLVAELVAEWEANWR